MFINILAIMVLVGIIALMFGVIIVLTIDEIKDYRSEKIKKSVDKAPKACYTIDTVRERSKSSSKAVRRDNGALPNGRKTDTNPSIRASVQPPKGKPATLARETAMVM